MFIYNSQTLNSIYNNDKNKKNDQINKFTFLREIAKFFIFFKRFHSFIYLKYAKKRSKFRIGSVNCYLKNIMN